MIEALSLGYLGTTLQIAGPGLGISWTLHYVRGLLGCNGLVRKPHFAA